MELVGSLNVIGYGLATIGPGLAVGMIFAALINGTARQPEAVGTLRPLAILGFVFAEVLAILAFVLAFAV